MVDQTPRHGFDTNFEPGDSWDYNGEFELLDELVDERGDFADRPVEGEYHNEAYHATDRRIVYRWDAPAGEWKAVAGLGDSENPVPGTAHFESASIGDANIDLHTSPRRELRVPDRTDKWCERRGVQNDNFEDLSSWTATAGLLSADTSNPYIGTQSAHLDPDGGTQTTIEKSVNLDLTGKTFSLAMRSTTPVDDRHTSLRIDAYDSAGDVLRWRTRPRYRDSDWVRYDFGAHPSFEGGAPDITDIQKIHIREDDGIEWFVDDLRIIRRRDQGAVVFTFDDGWETDYTEAYDYMQQYNMVGHSAIVPDYVGQTDRLDTTQMDEMYDYGWEFGSHTYNHNVLTQLTEEEQRTELHDSKKWLLNNGYTRGADHLTYPGGALDSTTMEIVGDYYKTGIVSQVGGAGHLMSSPYLLHRHDAENDPTATQDLISVAAQYGFVVVMMMHNIGTDISVSDFQAIVDTAAQEDVEVIGIEDLWEYQASLF